MCSNGAYLTVSLFERNQHNFVAAVGLFMKVGVRSREGKEWDAEGRRGERRERVIEKR